MHIPINGFIIKKMRRSLMKILFSLNILTNLLPNSMISHQNWKHINKNTSSDSFLFKQNPNLTLGELD